MNPRLEPGCSGWQSAPFCNGESVSNDAVEQERWQGLLAVASEVHAE
jgi:hypothetical protein